MTCATCEHHSIDGARTPFCIHPEVVARYPFGLAIADAIQNFCGPDLRLREPRDPANEDRAGLAVSPQASATPVAGGVSSLTLPPARPRRRLFSEMRSVSSGRSKATRCASASRRRAKPMPPRPPPASEDPPPAGARGANAIREAP